MVRGSARGAGGRGSIPDHVTSNLRCNNWEVSASQLDAWHWWARQLTGRLGFSIMDCVILFCSSVAELSRWLGTPKLLGVDRLTQTRQVQISSPRLHLHTPSNPPCCWWYDLESVKAESKPDPFLAQPVYNAHTFKMSVYFLSLLTVIRQCHMFYKTMKFQIYSFGFDLAFVLCTLRRLCSLFQVLFP